MTEAFKRLENDSQLDCEQWRPIATAPKDGTKIWACEDDIQYECWWHDDGRNSYWMDRFDSEPEPTHWRPRPDLPALTGDKGGGG